MNEILITLSILSILRFVLQTKQETVFITQIIFIGIATFSVLLFSDFCANTSLKSIDEHLSSPSVLQDFYCLVAIDFIWVIGLQFLRMRKKKKMWSDILIYIPSLAIIPSIVYIYEYLLFMQSAPHIGLYAVALAVIFFALVYFLPNGDEVEWIIYLSLAVLMLTVFISVVCAPSVAMSNEDIDWMQCVETFAILLVAIGCGIFIKRNNLLSKICSI